MRLYDPETAAADIACLGVAYGQRKFSCHAGINGITPFHQYPRSGGRAPRVC